MSTEAAPPPSYESVVNTMLAQTDGKTITFDQINAYAASLTPDQKAMVAAAPPPDPASLDPVEVAKFQAKVQADMLSPDAIAKFKDAATAAVQSCKDIDAMFMSLYALLAKIDNENGLVGTDQFLPRFSLIQNAWRETLKDSRNLAADVAVYAKGFGDNIMAVVADTTMDQTTKLELLNTAKEGTEGYNGRAEAINKQLAGIVDNFSAFAGTFGDWGKDKEGQLNADLVQAKKELSALLDQAQALRGQMIGFGVAVGVGALVAIGGCFAGPLAPLFWVAGGLIAASFGLALLAVGLEYKNVMDDINAKDSQIDALKQKVADIQNARTGLKTAGDNDVKFIQDHIGAVTGIWQCLIVDTDQIIDWVQKGQDYESKDIPPIIKLHMVQNQLAPAVALYDKVGEYMTEYATGMLVSGIPGTGSV